MNLAEIRKKAVKGEANGEARQDVFQPAPTCPASVPPSGPSVPLAQQSAPPELYAPEFPAPEFDSPEFHVPVAQPDPPQALWPGLGVSSVEFADGGDGDDGPDDDDGPDCFDPAAIILKGRESASFDTEGLQQDEVTAASLELLCFKVASEEYAINIMDIKEIIKPREVTEVPRVPPFVRGILSLRGNIIPIFDMRVRLGLAGGGVHERERVVVVKHQGGFAGVLVDEVVQVVRVAESGIEPPPVVLEGIDREFVLGIGRVAGRMLILLDMGKVLDVGLL